MKAAIASAVLAMLVVACGDDLDQPRELPALDVARMEAVIQPIWDRSCAQTSCHGDPNRPYRLYGRLGLRLPGHLGESTLSESESLANLRMSQGFLSATRVPERSLLLRKPLRDTAGGVGHAGGDQFYDRIDPDYLEMLCWLVGGGYPEAPECR